MIHQVRSVMLFMDNATVHLLSLKDKYSNILGFLVFWQNTTSHLQPLEAGIIQSFMVKFRKKLIMFVLVRIAENWSAIKVSSAVNILQAMQFAAKSWNEVSLEIVKNYFLKSRILVKQPNAAMNLMMISSRYLMRWQKRWKAWTIRCHQTDMQTSTMKNALHFQK